MEGIVRPFRIASALLAIGVLLAVGAAPAHAGAARSYRGAPRKRERTDEGDLQGAAIHRGR